MKFLVASCVVLWQLVQAQELPDSLKPYRCRRTDPEYSKCVLTAFEKTRALFDKGIPELNVPGVDPMVIPQLTFKRANNPFVSVGAVGKNIRVTGARSRVIEYLKADGIKKIGEMRVTFPDLHLEMDYQAVGQIFVIPVLSSGHLDGNFTDTEVFVKGDLKTYDKNGVEYYKVDRLDMKVTVGDGSISLTSNDLKHQFIANIATLYFNTNPRQVLDAVNPMFVEAIRKVMRMTLNKILSNLSAADWVIAENI